MGSIPCPAPGSCCRPPRFSSISDQPRSIYGRSQNRKLPLAVFFFFFFLKNFPLGALPSGFNPRFAVIICSLKGASPHPGCASLSLSPLRPASPFIPFSFLLVQEMRVLCREMRSPRAQRTWVPARLLQALLPFPVPRDAPKPSSASHIGVSACCCSANDEPQTALKVMNSGFISSLM